MPAATRPDPWISTGARPDVRRPPPGTASPVWEDDDSLLAIAEDRGDTHLHALPRRRVAARPGGDDGRISVQGFDAAGGAIATTRATIEHPSELYVGRRVRLVGDTLAVRMLGWEKFTVPMHRRVRRDRRWIMRPAGFDESARRIPCCSTSTAGRTRSTARLLRRGPDAGRRRVRRVMRNPRGGSGRHTRVGPGDHGHEAPRPPGQRMGLGRRRRRARRSSTRRSSATRSAIPIGSACSAAATAGTWQRGWRPYESDRFRAFCSERAVNNLCRRNGRATSPPTSGATTACSTIEDPAEYVRMSPIRGVAQHRQADADHPLRGGLALPDQQAEELWVALRLLGKEVTSTASPARTTSCRGRARRCTACSAPRSSSTGSPTNSAPADTFTRKMERIIALDAMGIGRLGTRTRRRCRGEDPRHPR